MDRSDPVAVFNERLAQSGKALLVVDEDLLREVVDVRDIVLKSADAGGVVFSQTEPPLSGDAAGREMEIVVLPLPEEAREARPLGYRARLRETGPDSLAFFPPVGVHDVSLRSVHRLEVKPEWKLWLRLDDLGGAELLDVSSRGALAVVAGSGPEQGTRLRFTLGQADDWEISGTATVRRAILCGEDGGARLALLFEPDGPGQAALLQRRLSALA